MARIRQLCCLDVGAKAAAPELTRLLLRLIPGYSASLFFADDGGGLVGIYDENPAVAEIAPLYVSEFYNSRESEVSITFTEAFRRGLVGMTLEQLIKVDRRTWERSDLYNLIRRPLGYASGIQLAVRDRGRPLGAVVMSRDGNAPEFSARDIDLLVALEPYLAQAFSRSATAMPLVESEAEEDHGLIITDCEGRIRHMSRQARVLLFYATHGQIAPGMPGTAHKLSLPPAIARLARTLAQVFEDKAVPPPVRHHNNGWGEFAFRASWLDGEDSKPPLIGIRISRREPVAIRLLRRMERLPLSERQIEVALHLASGRTYAEMAERLGVSRPTVIYHAQELFNKLGVANRAELQARLMAL
jgi:DNA-binding CsgD family transcriptional regulator